MGEISRDVCESVSLVSHQMHETW